jgi:hypothetical protein
VDSLGRNHFLAQTKPTSARRTPARGPTGRHQRGHVPTATGRHGQQHLEEFIELVNTSGNAVPLFDPLAPTNTWRLDGGVSFTFPQSHFPAMRSCQNFDPNHDFGALAAFKSRYAIPTTSCRCSAPTRGT